MNDVGVAAIRGLMWPLKKVVVTAERGGSTRIAFVANAGACATQTV